MGLAVEDCCSPRWPTRCEALLPEDGPPRDSRDSRDGGGLCRELTQVWGAGKGGAGVDAGGGCEEIDSNRWAEQEPDPEQVPVPAEEECAQAIEVAMESRQRDEDVAEMRRLAMELFERHEGAGS